MQKKTSSQIYSQYSAYPQNLSSREVLLKMAKVVQTQSATQAADKKRNETEEIKALLMRISNQLDCMQQTENSETAGNNAANQNQSETNTANQELQELFKQFLSNEKMNLQTAQAKNASQQQTPGSQPADNQNGNAAGKLTKQAAAQALAQAQYELADELEASLKKLKQVISESEKLANKISNLLGEENSNQG